MKIIAAILLTAISAYAEDYRREGWNLKITGNYDNQFGLGAGPEYSCIQAGNAVGFLGVYAVPKFFPTDNTRFELATGGEYSAFIAAFGFEITQKLQNGRYSLIMAPKIGTNPLGILSFYYSFNYEIGLRAPNSIKNSFELNVNFNMQDWKAILFDQIIIKKSNDSENLH
jgi:hypothetical protein